ncbi:hypothetical protein [Cytophaga aurantiaca]|uniref:hypothetical protein n=1 Tax=Cytophaga aurantiaca TaxID=29530 RepID=UPI0003772910|nr:hypothetical protein [Cytophaga aurantiaca]
MNRYFFICIVCFLSISSLKAQTGKYVYKDSAGYISGWIELFDSGRFEIVYGDACFNTCTSAGMYEIMKDSVQLKFFQIFPSQKEVIEEKKSDKKVHVSVQIFCLQDSSIVTSATIFARDSLGRAFKLDHKIDADGMKSLAIPKGKTIRYVRVSALNYIDCEIVFPEKYDTDFSIKIYLSKNPLLEKSYSGPIETQGCLYTNGTNEILFGEALLIKY